MKTIIDSIFRLPASRFYAVVLAISFVAIAVTVASINAMIIIYK